MHAAFLETIAVSSVEKWHPTPVLLPGKSNGWRSLVGCSPWGRWESDTTERLHFHFSLSCIGEGNGNPLQRSCLENPRDRGAWWADIYGVAQSRTRLKLFSSSSSNSVENTGLCTTSNTKRVTFRYPSFSESLFSVLPEISPSLQIWGLS